jgi:hypothetical protein
MAKAFGILLIVLGIWAGSEVYTKGAANAFGGALVALGFEDEAQDSAEPQSLGRRAGTKVGRAHAEADARRDRLLSE